jgi:hypothetical protein
MTDISRDWFVTAMDVNSDGSAPNLGLHPLLGPTGPAKFKNVGRNLTERRITVHQASCSKP